MSGCFDSETKEREAFKTFLQTRIVDKPGLHVPILTAEEGRALGRYKDHYEVITRFHDRMNNQVSGPLQESIKAGTVRSISDLTANKANLLKVQEAVKQLRNALDTAQATAEAEKKRLAQPDDLKPVYTQAFERNVTRPAETFRTIFPAVDGIFDTSLQIVAFLEKNQGRWRMSGSSVEFKDAQLLNQFNRLATDLASKSRAAVESQQKMRALISGQLPLSSAVTQVLSLSATQTRVIPGRRDGNP